MYRISFPLCECCASFFQNPKIFSQLRKNPSNCKSPLKNMIFFSKSPLKNVILVFSGQIWWVSGVSVKLLNMTAFFQSIFKILGVFLNKTLKKRLSGASSLPIILLHTDVDFQMPVARPSFQVAWYEYEKNGFVENVAVILLPLFCLL